MESASPPSNERERLTSLIKLDILDSEPEPEFDALVQAAALVCGVPTALISLIDSDRQWFKANIGLEGVTQTPRDISLCGHAIRENSLFEIPDASLDARFADNPLVVGEPRIRFYAGVPLRLHDGANVGTLCVIDQRPKQLSDDQRQILANLASAAVKALEGRRASRALNASEARSRALADSSPLGVFSTDISGACTYTNECWQTIFGLGPQESMGDGWSRTLHPDDRALVFGAWQSAADTGTEFDMQFRVQPSTVTLRHVRTRARPTIGANGVTTGFVGTVEDITSRVTFEKALADEHARLETANERLALATDSGRIGIWEYDLEGNTLHGDSWMCRLFGIPEKHNYGTFKSWLQHLHAHDRPVFEQAVRNVIANNELLDCEFRVVLPDGAIRHQHAKAQVTHDATGRPTRLIGVMWDVTDLRALSAELAAQHELLQFTLQSIADAVITTDGAGRVTWLNPVAERLTGWTASEAAAVPIENVFHIVDEHTRATLGSPVARCLGLEGETDECAYTVLIARNGEQYGIENSVAPIRNASGEALGAALIFRDVTAQRRVSSEVAHRATHDPLTTLVNRAEFETRAARALHKAHEHHSVHALLFIDLDQFKIVNDSCGHAVGDLLLQEVSKLLIDTVRARDTVARLGGDEFGVILEHCSTDQAQSVAQKICDRVSNFRFMHDERRFRIGTSIGLVPLDNRWCDAPAALRAADASCYVAKRAGRNRVHIWLDSDHEMQARQGETQWVERIGSALDEDRFRLLFQNIEALNGSHHGLYGEVLLRLVDLDGSLILPHAFMPTVERYHLAPRLDRWVLQHVIEALAALDDLTNIGTVCVNLSGKTISDETFHLHAIEILGEAGPEVCRRLCLEISEMAVITNMTDATWFIRQLRALGVRVALDDFGASAPSFGYLKTLPVDLLKIDGQIITALTDDELANAAVRGLVDVARVIGVKTVAKSVERVEVWERLRQLGVDYAQGFLLHQPEPLNELLRRSQSRLRRSAVGKLLPRPVALELARPAARVSGKVKRR